MKKEIDGREDIYLENLQLEQKVREDLKVYDILYLQGPAGWGKYTFLKNYKNHTERTVIWIETAEDIEQQTHPFPEECVVIIPKLELLVQEEVQEWLWNRIREKKRRQKFLIASVIPLPEFLLYYAASRRLMVYSTKDLKPSVEDVDTYFQKRGLALGAETLLKIEKDFENMPLCLYLLENPLRNSVRGYCGAVREQCMEDVYSYLDMTCFRMFSLRVQDSLLRLFCFEILTRELIKEILGISEEEVQKFLDIIILRGSVVEPVGPGKWKFCPLFGKFLKRVVHKYIDIDELMELYRKGMSYFRKQEDYYSALKFAVLLNDEDRMADFLNRYMGGHVGYEVFVAMEDYYHQIPAGYLLKYPRLLAAGAMMEAIGGNYQKAEQYKNILTSFLEECHKPELQQEIEENLVYLQLAMPGAASWDALKQTLEKAFHYRDGSISRWKQGFRPNQISVLHGDKDYCLCLEGRANIQFLMDELETSVGEAFGNYFHGLFYFIYAEICYEYNQLDHALNMLSRSLQEAKKRKDAVLTMLCNLKLGDIRIVKNEAQNNEAFIKRLMDETLENNELFMINLRAHQMDYELLAANQEQIRKWMEEEAPDENDRFYTTQYYQYLMKAKVYIWQENYILARMILLSLKDFSESFGMYYLGIQVRLFEAVIYFREKNERWKEVLEDALERSHRIGFIRVIADEGAAIYELLLNYGSEQEEWMQDVWFKALLQAARTQMLLFPQYLKQQKKLEMAMFSSHELDILRLLAQGEKNAEIAKKLCVSENTVKYHLKNIYQKLDVKNRSQAIHRIREEQLL